MKKKRQRPDLIISSFDKERLLRLLGTDADAASAATALDVRAEIERGREVRPEEIPPDVVTMNTQVIVRDLESGEETTWAIVFPADADPQQGRLSILNGLAVELIGCREGDVVTVKAGGRARRLSIEKILYQPEAAGDYHL